MSNAITTIRTTPAPMPEALPVQAPAKAKALPHPMQDPVLGILHHATVSLVADRAAPDLNARQLAALLIMAREDGPHTVRGLAAVLRIGKPSVSRALDRLEDLGMVRRQRDTFDGRSVILTMQGAGLAHVRRLQAALAAAGEG